MMRSGKTVLQQCRQPKLVGIAPMFRAISQLQGGQCLLTKSVHLTTRRMSLACVLTWRLSGQLWHTRR